MTSFVALGITIYFLSSTLCYAYAHFCERSCSGMEPSNLLRALYGGSLVDCRKSCSLRISCRVYSFYRKHKECKLYSMNVTSHAAENHIAKETFYGEITESERDDDELGICRNHSCPQSTVCEEINGEISCKIRECPIFQFDNVDINREVLGNMNNVGSKIKVRCNNTKMAVQGHDFSECLPNGTWSGTASSSRCRFYCDELPSTEPNAIQVELMVYEVNITDKAIVIRGYFSGSYVIYKCKNGSYLAGGNTKVSCHKGHWFGKPSCRLVDENCPQKMCKCDQYLSYNASAQECVDKCTTYFTTPAPLSGSDFKPVFQVFHNVYISFDGGNSIGAIRKDCVEQCAKNEACISLVSNANENGEYCIHNTANLTRTTSSYNSTYYKKNCALING